MPNSNGSNGKKPWYTPSINPLLATISLVQAVVTSRRVFSAFEMLFVFSFKVKVSLNGRPSYIATFIETMDTKASRPAKTASLSIGFSRAQIIKLGVHSWSLHPQF
jgi:hypothetical protein